MRSPAPPDHEHAIEEIDPLLRAHGLRRTPQRHVTLEAIARLAGHATADQIVDRVKKKLPSISPSTVYRTLGTLEEVGIICHAHLGHTASVYHVGTAGLHQHLVCERCGALQEVDDSVTKAFSTQLTKRFGFRANFTHFAVLGLCRACSKRPKAKAGGGRAQR